ncbi:MAG TPA: ABC transporter permease [Geobacterales bacterium]|nr:ABC transporter permease [Geobacterales bacterium]
MRVINQVMGIVEAELRSLLREVSWFIGISSFPFLFAFVAYALGSGMGGRPADPRLLFYQLIGLAMYIVALMMTFSAASFVREGLLTGRLEYLLSSPISPFTMIFSNMISSSLFGLINYIIVGVVATIIAFGFAGILNFIVSLLVLYVALIPAIGFSLIFLAVSIIVREPEPIANLIASFIAVVSGFLYPVTLLPYVLQIIGRALPYYYAVEYARSTVQGFINQIFTMPFPFMFFYLIAGYLIYKYFERAYIKKKGTYGW